MNITWTRLRLTVGTPLSLTTPVPGPEAVINITWTRLRLTVGSPLASMTCPSARGCDEYYLDKTEADCRQTTGLCPQDQRL